MTPELATIAEIQGGPFTVRQARLAGLTRGRQRQLEKEGRLTALRKGILIETEGLLACNTYHLHRVEAVGAFLLRELPPDPSRGIGPGPLFAAAHRSAGLFWDLRCPLPPPNPDPLPVTWREPAPTRHLVEFVSADRNRRSYNHGVHARPAAMEQADVAVRDGLFVTSLERTAVDLARELSRRDAIIAVDSALQLGASRERMRIIAAQYRGWRGTTQAKEVVEFGDGRAESATESWARLVLKDHRMPIPDLQVDLSDARGPVARVDMIYREQRTIIEADGMIKYTDPWADPREVLVREKLREDRLRDAGWEVVRVTWRQLEREPVAFVDRVRRAFARARHPVSWDS